MVTTLERGGAGDLGAARLFVERNLDARQVNKVLHSFPSPRLWTEEQLDARRLLTERAPAAGARPLALYVGVPFCLKTDPDRCGYCLFPVEVYTGNRDLEVYFEYLAREGELYRGLFERDRLVSVYFGGGTSNLYRADYYERLMDLVRAHFTVPADATVTLEGIPQLFSREKLERIRAAGMNRVSMGVQQMNDELNRLSGRKQTVQHTLQSIEWCQELGLPCNVDLIFGWPRQTVATMLADLELLVGTGVHHITHYELNVGGPTDFALNRRHELPSVQENLEMYRVSRDFLRAAGYRQLTPYDWEKPDPAATGPLYEECDRGFERLDLFGWGYAAVSYLEGGDGAAWTSRNHTSVADYYRSIDEGRIPVERGFVHEPVDHRLSQLFRNLQGMAVDRAAYLEAFGLDVVDEHAAAWEALAERGFVEVSRDAVRVVGDGVFYIPLIQTLLARGRIGELSRQRMQGRGLPLA